MANGPARPTFRGVDLSLPAFNAPAGYRGASYYQDPHARTLIDMMMQNMQMGQRHADREQQRSAERWNMLANMPTQAYQTYLGVKDQQRAEEDRLRAEEDRQRAIRNAAQLAERADAIYQLEQLRETPVSLAAAKNLEGVEFTPVGDRSGAPVFSDSLAFMAAQPTPEWAISEDGELTGGPRQIPVAQGVPTADPTEAYPSFSVPSSTPGGKSRQVPFMTLEDIMAQESRAFDLEATQAGIAAERELDTFRAKEGIKAGHGETAAQRDFENRQTLMEQEQGYALKQIGVNNANDLHKLEVSAQNDYTRMLLGKEMDYKTALELGSRQMNPVTGGVMREVDGKNVMVAAYTPDILDEEGNAIIITPTDENGDFYVIQQPTVVQTEAEKLADQSAAQLSDSEKFIGETVAGAYETIAIPRNQIVDGEVRDLSLFGALQRGTGGIAGMSAPLWRVWQDVTDTNVPAIRLREELKEAATEFAHAMQDVGHYRATAQSVEDILARFGELTGGVFAGDDKIAERGKNVHEFVNKMLAPYLNPATLPIDPKERGKVQNMINHGIDIQQLLGFPGLPLFGEEYLSQDEINSYRPRGGQDIKEGALE